MIIMGLDIAKERTGIGLLNDMKVLGYHAIELPKDLSKIKADDDEFSKVLVWYQDEFSKYFENTNADIISMERLNMEFMRSAKTMIQFQTVARLAAFNNGYLISTVHNKTVKSMFKIPVKNKMPIECIEKAREFKISKSQKIYMVDKVNEVFGLNLEYYQNDEADAIAVAFTKMRELKCKGKENQ